MSPLLFDLREDTFELHASKAIYWPSKNSLLLADLHLGKANHFRKSGIAVPQKASDRNTERIIDLIHTTSPERVLLLGDLFHSEYNPEWEVFGQIVQHFHTVSFELIMGNHDIMSSYQYEKHGLRLHHKPLSIGPFLLSHEPLAPEEIPEGKYNLAGHLHPGVHIRGKGRQGMTLPCFFFGEQQGLLPAFGTFTGLYRLKVRQKDHVFVVAEDQVIAVNQ